MTVAVCLKCGEFKHGAFTRCEACGYEPDDDESLTKHLLVTDHYHNRETLEAIAARVKAGEPITFDPQTLEAAKVSKKDLDASMKRVRRGCILALMLIITLAVVGTVLFVTLSR